MKKKGFTLVELLAVIAILAILVIIALPNVLGMFNQAKKNTFVTELQSIYSTGETQFVSDSMGDMTNSTSGIFYGRVKGKTMTAANGVTNADFRFLDLSGTTSIDYYIHFNLAGKVVEFYATDGQFQYIYNGPGLEKQDIKPTTIKSNGDVFDANNKPKNASILKLGTITAGQLRTTAATEINTGVITIADASYIDGGNITKVTFVVENETAKIQINQ